MEFHSSGHFSFQDKLKDAATKLLHFGIIAIIAGIVYVAYMISYASAGTLSHIITISMAMSNTYALLLITVLVGNGLVGVPKRLWMMSDTEMELSRLYISSVLIEERYQEARYELHDVEQEVSKGKRNTYGREYTTSPTVVPKLNTHLTTDQLLQLVSITHTPTPIHHKPFLQLS